MEEKPKSAASNALFYGSLTGVVAIIYSLLLYLFDQSFNNWLVNVAILIFIAGMILGTVQYRNKYLNGFMTYSQAFGSCFLIGLFAAIVGSIYSFIFFNFIDPGMIQQMNDIARERMLSQTPEMTEDQVDKAMSFTRMFTNSYAIPIMSLIVNTIISVVLGLIIAIFIKKEDKSLTPTI